MTPATNPIEPNYNLQRLNMVEGQLRPNGIKDERILCAMESLPRERFVPQQLAGIAYIDEELSLSPRRALLRPLVLARLVQGASIQAEDIVLDIGSLSGYSSALLAHMAKKVIALENDKSMSDAANSTLMMLGLKNVEAASGPLQEGWRAHAPYNVIILNGSIEVLPEPLTEQMAEGGRLVTVFRHYGPGQAAHTGEVRLYQKINGHISHRVMADATATLIPEFARIQTFKF